MYKRHCFVKGDTSAFIYEELDTAKTTFTALVYRTPKKVFKSLKAAIKYIEGLGYISVKDHYLKHGIDLDAPIIHDWYMFNVKDKKAVNVKRHMGWDCGAFMGDAVHCPGAFEGSSEVVKISVDLSYKERILFLKNGQQIYAKYCLLDKTANQEFYKRGLM